MGRKPVLDHIKRSQICAMVALGCSRRRAARYVGCAATTIRHTAMHDRQFREQLRAAERQAEIIPLKNLQSHAANNWRAAAWLLERTFPGTYARRGPGDLSTDAVREVVSQLGRDIGAEIPDGEVRQRIERIIRAWEEQFEKEQRAEADRLLDGRRRKSVPVPQVARPLPGDWDEGADGEDEAELSNNRPIVGQNPWGPPSTVSNNPEIVGHQQLSTTDLMSVERKAVVGEDVGGTQGGSCNNEREAMSDE